MTICKGCIYDIDATVTVNGVYFLFPENGITSYTCYRHIVSFLPSRLSAFVT